MDIRFYVTFGAGLAFTAVLLLGIWALALRFRNPKLKRLMMPVGFACLLVLVANGFNHYLQNAPTPDFVTESPGPPHGVVSEWREVKFPVTEAQARQIVELTMRAEEVAQGNIVVQCRVVDPNDKQLASSEQTVEPGEGRYWRPMRFEVATEFQGDYKLLVEIPKGVDIMRVVVKEVAR